MAAAGTQPRPAGCDAHRDRRAATASRSTHRAPADRGAPGRERARAPGPEATPGVAGSVVGGPDLSAALAAWYLTEGRFTTAPALESLSKADAERVASKVGLSIDFSEEYSETVRKGMVISTNPGPGTKILRGGKIEASLSKGPERYPMPAVVGLSRVAAEAAVQKAKLAVGKVTDGYSDQVAAGTVFKASERAGASLKKAPQSILWFPVGRSHS